MTDENLMSESPWQPISAAPYGRDLELAVIEGSDAPHILVFPCRRVQSGWANTTNHASIDVHPTHWRDWHKRDELR